MTKNTKNSGVPVYIVTARSDGRGGIRPFGTYGKAQAGARVEIHGKNYLVTKDGRVNIPKSIMDKGIKGADGRRRITIQFSTLPGKDGWRQVKTITAKPLKKDMNKKSGEKTTKHRIKNRDEVVPVDVSDYNWSV